MPTETQEHKNTQKALDEVAAWMKSVASGGAEGISWSLSRVTEDLFGDSFLAGGDASRFTASGKRGTLNSQESNAMFFTNAAGPSVVVTQVPIALTFDLNTAKVSLSWTPPGAPAPSDVTFTAELNKKTPSQNAEADLVFYADTASRLCGVHVASDVALAATGL